MKNALTLTEKETFFIQENRQDPITGDGFGLGDQIVFCASCKSAFLRESWEYMNYEHCGQYSTLKKFPVSSELKLSKQTISTYIKADVVHRFFAYLIDSFIGFSFGLLFYFLLHFFTSKDTASTLSTLIGIVYMLIRDVILIETSIGKKIMGLHFINLKTKDKVFPVILFFRNIIYWLSTFVVLLMILFFENVTNGNGSIEKFLGFALIIANISHLFFVVVKKNHFLDRMLNLELVETKK